MNIEILEKEFKKFIKESIGIEICKDCIPSFSIFDDFENKYNCNEFETIYVNGKFIVIDNDKIYLYKEDFVFEDINETTSQILQIFIIKEEYCLKRDELKLFNKEDVLKCPRCSSEQIRTERRINGDHICEFCGNRWKNERKQYN